MLAAHHCPVTRAGLLLTALSCIAITFESIIMVAAVSSNQTCSAGLTKEFSGVRRVKSSRRIAPSLHAAAVCACVRAWRRPLPQAAFPLAGLGVIAGGATPPRARTMSACRLRRQPCSISRTTPKCPCPAAMCRLVLSVREASRQQFLLSCLQQRTNSVTVVFCTRVVQSITSCDRPGG